MLGISVITVVSASVTSDTLIHFGPLQVYDVCKRTDLHFAPGLSKSTGSRVFFKRDLAAVSSWFACCCECSEHRVQVKTNKVSTASSWEVLTTRSWIWSLAKLGQASFGYLVWSVSRLLLAIYPIRLNLCLYIPLRLQMVYHMLWRVLSSLAIHSAETTCSVALHLNNLISFFTDTIWMPWIQTFKSAMVCVPQVLREVQKSNRTSPWHFCATKVIPIPNVVGSMWTKSQAEDAGGKGQRV